MKPQFVLLFLFLVGCSSNPFASPPALTETIPITGPSPTETPALPTPTSSPPTPSPFPIFTSAPTLEPLPILLPDVGMATLQAWLQGTFDCLLPCWGGITPGITTWQEAKQILEQLSGFASVNSAENMSCSFGQCNGVGWSLYPDTLAEGYFYAKTSDNIIHVIHLDIRNEGSNKSNLLRNIRLRDIFGWYGAPAMLLLNAGPEPEGNNFLELFMVYPDRQFVIQYFKKAEVTGDRVVSCQDDSRIRLIVLDNKEQLASLDSIASAVETQDLRIGAGHKSVEEAMGMTINAFHAAYGQRDEPCISTPVSIWGP